MDCAMVEAIRSMTMERFMRENGLKIKGTDMELLKMSKVKFT